jgi:hypothetical protein
MCRFSKEHRLATPLEKLAGVGGLRTPGRMQWSCARKHSLAAAYGGAGGGLRARTTGRIEGQQLQATRMHDAVPAGGSYWTRAAQAAHSWSSHHPGPRRRQASRSQLSQALHGLGSHRRRRARSTGPGARRRGTNGADNAGATTARMRGRTAVHRPSRETHPAQRRLGLGNSPSPPAGLTPAHSRRVNPSRQSSTLAGGRNPPSGWHNDQAGTHRSPSWGRPATGSTGGSARVAPSYLRSTPTAGSGGQALVRAQRRLGNTPGRPAGPARGLQTAALLGYTSRRVITAVNSNNSTAVRDGPVRDPARRRLGI